MACQLVDALKLERQAAQERVESLDRIIEGKA